MARATLSEILNRIDQDIQENTSGDITATTLNELLDYLSNNLYLPTDSTVTVNNTAGIKEFTFGSGLTVTVDGLAGTVEVSVADPVLPVDVCRIGFADYNDAATGTTPINVPGTLTDVDLTNDEQGSFTNKNYLPVGITDIWDAVTNRFDFSDLKLGDMVDIRLDLDVTTTSPNQLVEIDLVVAEGAGTYNIPFIDNVYKNAGTQRVNRYNGLYMGDLNTQANPAKFVIRSDDTATVRVNGWYTKILIRG